MAAQKHSCIVIGGGISGLMASRRLVENNIDVLVLDKGRRAGGRMSTRQSGNLKFDHGAQAIKTGSGEFNTFIEAWNDAGILESCHYQEKSDSDFASSEYYCVKSGIANLPIYLTSGLNVKTGSRVTGLMFEEKLWTVLLSEDIYYKADSVIMTPPLPQILEILGRSDIKLSEKLYLSLRKIKYERCITLLADCILSEELSSRNFLRPNSGPIALIVNNHKKGVSSAPGALTIQANGEFSEENWDLADNYLIEKILDYNEGRFRYRNGYLRIHRWRYSRAVNSYPEPFLIMQNPGLIAFAGDSFSGDGIEGAAISGIRAAEAIISEIG